MTASTPMLRALELAAQARHSTAPNPMVGAVLVRDGAVVGEGWHVRAGEAHAEALALLQAGERARGATLYVTLEPCAHHGRTGPCADAVAAAGVERVVVAMPDPDPRVDGRGLARLRQASVAVEVGDGAADALALNRAWIAARRAARPFVGLKLAMSLDGRIATTTGESRWITGPESRAEAHRLRAAYAAVAVGAGTVLADDPELTARDAAGARLDRQPLRLVVDGRLRISPGARLLDPGLPGRALVATSAGGAAARGAEFAGTLLVVGDDGASAGDGVSAGGGAAISAGPTFPSPTTAANTGPDPRRVAMADLLRVLAGQGVDSLLVEGGGDLAWSFVAAGLVDHVHALVAPILIGGREAPSAVSGEGFARLENALGLRFVATRNLGDDLLLEAIPASTRPGAPDSEGTPGEAPPTSPGAESSTREP